MESSIVGLRSAIYVLSSPDTSLKFLIVPMVHIGDEQYYAAIQQKLSSCDTVFFEGVPGLRTKIITSCYKFIAKRKSLNLVLQRDAIKLRDLDANLIHGDVDVETFDTSWRKVPLGKRLILYVSAPLFGILGYLVASRELVAEGHTVDSIPISLGQYCRESKTAIRSAFVTDRDRVLIGKLDSFIRDHSGRSETAAIIYGASHMPNVVEYLTGDRGYRVESAEWLSAISLDY